MPTGPDKHPTMLCRQQGIALVLVLWIAIGLTAIGAAMSVSLQRELRGTTHILEAAQARQAARAALSRGLVELRNLEIDEVRQWALNGAAGQWLEFTWAGFTVRYRAFEESGRIDINQADRVIIAGLLEAAGVSASDVNRLADNLLDWRDPSPETRLSGTSPAAYRNLGLPEGRRDGDFETIEELQQVDGYTADIYRALAPHITVHTLARRPNPEHASILVLAAHPGVDRDFAKRWARDRKASRAAGSEALPPFPGGARGGRTNAFGLEAIAIRDGQVKAHAEMVFSLDEGARLPITLLEWREPPLWKPGPDYD